jgi:hypothetical protein
LGASKGKVSTAKFGRRSRAKGAAFFKCPVITVEASFDIAEVS